MTDIIVNASTSLVNINTSNIALGSNAVVLLSSVNSPGAIITIRDYIGFASTNRKIIISTTSDTQFLDGPGISSFEITTPYGYFTVSPRSPSIWTVLNSFAFGTQANASVSSLVVTGQIVSDRILNASTFSTSHVQTSSLRATSYLYGSSIASEFINASTISTPFLNVSTMNVRNANISTISSVIQNTSSLIVTGQASTAVINTSSLFINGSNAFIVTTNSLSTSKLNVSSIVPFVAGQVVTVEGVLRPSTIAINQTSAIAPLDIIGPNTDFTTVTENGGNCIQLATGKASGNQTLVMGNSSNLSTSYIQAIRVNTFGSALALSPRGGNILLGSRTEGGRVGIRTSVPSTTLHVIGSETVGSNANTIALFQAATTLNTNDAGVIIGSINGNTPFLSDNDSTASAGLIFRTANTERMRINRSNGFVGIGTINPSYRLTVASGDIGVDNTQQFFARNSSGNYETFLTPRGSDNIFYATYGAGGMNIRNSSLSTTAFFTNNNRMGVGLTNPVAKLDVFDGTRPASVTSADPNYGLKINDNSNGGILQGGDINFSIFFRVGRDNTIGTFDHHSFDGYRWYTNGFIQSQTEKMRLTTAGNLGIGTSTPTSRLQVNNGGIVNALCNTATTTADANLILQNSADTGFNRIQFYTALSAGNYNSLVGNNDKAIIVTDGSSLETGNLVIGPHSGSAKGIKIMSNGNIGIGTASPSTTLHVNGVGFASSYFKHPGSIVNMYVNTEGSWTSSGPFINKNVFTYTPKQSGTVTLYFNVSSEPYLTGGSGFDFIAVALTKIGGTVLSFNKFNYDDTTARYYRESVSPLPQGITATTTITGSTEFYLAFTVDGGDTMGCNKSVVTVFELAN